MGSQRKGKKRLSRGREFLAEVCRTMEKKGVSRADLAGRLGCSISYVSKLLNGRSNLTLESIEKLTSALGLDFELSLDAAAETSGEGTVRSPESDHAQENEDPEESKPGQYPRIQSVGDVRAFLATAAPGLRNDLIELFRQASDDFTCDRGPGRRPGAAEDYQPHLMHMAMLIESGTTDSERRASKLAETWGKRQGHAFVSWETLRTHFRKTREFYLAQAREVLIREQEGEGSADVRDAPRRSRGSSAALGEPGDRVPRSLNEPLLSSLGWVQDEIDRISGCYSLGREKAEWLRLPGVLEQIGHFAEVQEERAIKTLQLAAERASFSTMLSEHVKETKERLDGALMPDLGRITRSLYVSNALRAAMVPDLRDLAAFASGELTDASKAMLQHASRNKS